LQLGMVAFVGIVFQTVGNEVLEVPDGGVRSAGEGIDRLNGAIEVFESGRDVVAERVGSERFGLVPRVLRLGAVRCDEEPGQSDLEIRAHVLQQEVVATEDG